MKLFPVFIFLIPGVIALGMKQKGMLDWDTPDQAFPGNGQRKERDEEVAQLQKALRDAQMENEILKKAVAIFTRSQR